MKKVMLLGDSIRLSYMPFVKEMLEGKATVWGPEDNCRFAKYTLWCIAEWVGQCGKPDIIHWNNGIWDVYTQNKEIGIFTPIEEYLKDMKRVYIELKKIGAKIIFATTTATVDAVPLKNTDIELYNAAVVDFLKDKDVSINDLYTYVKQGGKSFMDNDGFHLSELGQKSVAEKVTETIRCYL